MFKKNSFSNYKILLLPVLVLGFLSIAFFSHAATVVIHPTRTISNVGTPGSSTWKAQQTSGDPACINNNDVVGSTWTGWACVNDQPSNAVSGAAVSNDGNTTYIRTQLSSDASNEGIFGFGGSLVPAGSTISDLSVVSYGAPYNIDTGGNYQLFYSIGSGSKTFGIAHTPSLGLYEQFIDNFSGLSLSSSQLDQLQIGLRQTSVTANDRVRVTQVYVTVTYSVVVPDTTPPAAVLNLAASNPTASSMLLSWTAPGDDGASGTATSYDIRYSTSNITDANWASATQVSGEPAPLIAGSSQSMTVSGLTASTLYYFAMKTSDEVPNISPLSNVASLATLAPPPPPNLSGYAWADNGIGWVSFNCANGGVCGTSNYGVTVDAAGVMSGYAWANPNDGAQNHIGWINFAPAGPYPVSSFVPAQSVRMDRAAGTVRGWARAVSYDVSGGWDGWIGFGSGGNYGSGVTVSGCNWSGYTWGGGTVIGWIHFVNSPTYQVTGSGNGCALSSFDYSLSNSGNITVNAGSSGSNTITITLVSGSTQGVTLSNSVLPAGASAVFTNNPCSPNCSSQLTITTILSTLGGSYPITVTGNPLGRTTSFNLIVNAPPSPPVSVTATAASGANACKTINVSWDSSLFATGYNVGRCVGAGCTSASPSWTPVASMVSGTSAQDTTASDGIIYRYGVSACLNAMFCSVPTYSATVVNNAPEVSFNYTPSSIVINQLAKFAGMLIGGNATTSQSWTFAGGNPATSLLPSPSSSFLTSGSHAVTYTATNGFGSCTVPGSVSVSQGTFGNWCELPPDAPPGTPCP